jgi:hypothetical protein
MEAWVHRVDLCPNKYAAQNRAMSLCQSTTGENELQKGIEDLIQLVHFCVVIAHFHKK